MSGQRLYYWVNFNIVFALWLIFVDPFGEGTNFFVDGFDNSEQLWGAVLLTLTLLKLLAFHMKWRRVLVVSNAGTTAFWGMFALTLIIAEWRWTSTPAYAFMTVLAIDYWVESVVALASEEECDE